MTLLCDTCAVFYPGSVAIEPHAIMQKCQEFIKTSDIGNLNKFLLSGCPNLNSLICEVRNFLYDTLKRITSDSRCQYCLQKLGLGNSTPLRFNCDQVTHTICYNCYEEPYNRRCKICKSNYTDEIVYEDALEKFDFLVDCSNKQCKLDSKINIPYKTSCFHHYCKPCLDEQSDTFLCKSCHYLNDKSQTKLDKKLVQRLMCLEFTCPEHDRFVTSFSWENLDFYCPDCNYLATKKGLLLNGPKSYRNISFELEVCYTKLLNNNKIDIELCPANLQNKINKFKRLTLKEQTETLKKMEFIDDECYTH